MIVRCQWAEGSQIYRDYHDNEWGKAQYDSRKLFEKICLEGQQAGLSWITILKKRENYRAAFYQFDPVRIAQMTELDIDTLMQNEGLIRHRGKLQAIVTNAKAYLVMEKSGQNFSDFIWSFVNHQRTETSKAMSKALKKLGFAFVGETTCYAFMQSMGLVDDHLNSCFCKMKGQ